MSEREQQEQQERRVAALEQELSEALAANEEMIRHELLVRRKLGEYQEREIEALRREVRALEDADGQAGDR